MKRKECVKGMSFAPMFRVELIFFGTCPNIEKARQAIRAGGISDFLEVNQDKLENSDPRMRYSSPAVLLNGELIAGSETGATSCSVVDWKKVSALIAKRIAVAERIL